MLYLQKSFDYNKGKTRIVFNMRGDASTEENKGGQVGIHRGNMKNFVIM
jgi:hypothetical protein